MQSIKLCECGCGQPAPISTYTKRREGVVKGQPKRFINFHQNKVIRWGPIERRFWDKVCKTDTCWLWTGPLNESGYGAIGYAGKRDRAHRVSWRLHFGQIPNGLWVLHKCDNPACVNPEHLFLGTRADNMADMDSKGRRRGTVAPGESHPYAKLTDADVMAIRQRAASGERYRKLWTEYGVTKRTIIRIVKRQGWTHLP